MTNYELTIKDVNKSNSKFEIRNLKFVIIFIFLVTLVGVGLFGWAGKADAADGICTVVGVQTYPMTKEQCIQKAGEKSMERFKITWYDLRAGPNPDPTQIETIKEASKEETAASPMGSCLPPDGMGPPSQTTETNCTGTWTKNPENTDSAGTKSDFENQLRSCKVWNGDFDACIIKFSYYVFFVVPSFLLAISASFFNTIVGIALNSAVLKLSFVSSAWGVVRDLSNLFFILVLLYIAIKIILGLGGSEVKKMIINVIIMALLINFSMFFTKIVIDTSNVLALIFYNKLSVLTPDGKEIPYLAATVIGEKNLTGAMINAFDVTKMLKQPFLEGLKVKLSATPVTKGEIVGAMIFPVYGGYLAYSKLYDWIVQPTEIPTGTMLAIILIAGAILLFAAYCFLVAGFSFLSRLIELFVLIIFSPFAFMSSTIPKMAGIESLGWDSWIKRLLSVSFMAPIFMFFMYFIFMLINANIFKDLLVPGESQDTQASILFIILPALLILVLLLQATKYAKKGSGVIGEAVFAGAKVISGLALGAATGGVAMAGRATAGAVTKAASTSESAKRFAQAGTPAARAALGNWDKTFGRFGHYINKDQEKVEHSAHARHELDKESGARFDGKKFSQLTGVERDIVKERITRDHKGEQKYGKTYNKLNAIEKADIDALIAADLAAGIKSQAEKLVEHSKEKQGLGSTILQSARTGTYDVRNLANVVAKEQTTGFAKMTMGLTGAVASLMRGGLKQAGVNYGNVEGKFFKDLASTISESLKNAKINVDLSHVGEVKKEDSHGGGHGGH